MAKSIYRQLCTIAKGVTPKDLEKPMQYLVNENAQPQVAAGMKPYLVPLKNIISLPIMIL